ncbi:hypothetical protein BC939DRAFT_449952 [Gamsiella multidivaricata]|uniref:uncharacterized protein n=1 Tax=Gamsiella multidivaricata TaxID=101098 RepID=UPI00221E6D2F|nr:uncharacterized protein BC939DRAFT_449952 [Gamsiella multidivaricata]KAI7824300.1 hypothetical protein BC939DRAFT_449952 [Gamsiella multidivaricata]
MPSISNSGCSLKRLTSIKSPLMVSAVEEPMRKAPRNSQTEAIRTACLRFRAPEPTAAPKLLLTSLAPMPKLSRKAKTIPMAKRNV